MRKQIIFMVLAILFLICAPVATYFIVDSVQPKNLAEPPGVTTPGDNDSPETPETPDTPPADTKPDDEKTPGEDENPDEGGNTEEETPGSEGEGGGNTGEDDPEPTPPNPLNSEAHDKVLEEFGVDFPFDCVDVVEINTNEDDGKLASIVFTCDDVQEMNFAVFEKLALQGFSQEGDNYVLIADGIVTTISILQSEDTFVLTITKVAKELSMQEELELKLKDVFGEEFSLSAYEIDESSVELEGTIMFTATNTTYEDFLAYINTFLSPEEQIFDMGGFAMSFAPIVRGDVSYSLMVLTGSPAGATLQVTIS